MAAIGNGRTASSLKTVKLSLFVLKTPGSTLSAKGSAMFKVIIDAKDFRLWRAGHNITSAEAAELLGVSRRTVWAWEAGRSLTPRDLAERLAKADAILVTRAASGQLPSKARAASQRQKQAIKAYWVASAKAREEAIKAARRKWLERGCTGQSRDDAETREEYMARVNRELIDLFGTTGEDQ